MDEFMVSEVAFRNGAKAAITKMREFLDNQTNTVKSMVILSEKCKECYLSSQENRLNALKDIAKELGVEEDGKG